MRGQLGREFKCIPRLNNSICPFLSSFTPECGKVFTWGRGDYGQLGRPTSNSLVSVDGGHQRAQSVPSELKELQGATQVRRLRHQTTTDSDLLLCQSVQGLQGAADTTTSRRKPRLLIVLCVEYCTDEEAGALRSSAE